MVIYAKLPELKTAKELATFLVASQIKVYGKTSELTFSALVRNFKLLLKEYSAFDITYCIVRATHLSDYPFSTKFIREQLEWLELQRNCPVTKNYERLEPNK